MFPSDTLNTILEMLGCWLLLSFAFGLLLFVRYKLAQLRKLDMEHE
jgi:hypothetical protein